MPHQHQVYELFIRATPATVWAALTDPSITERYFFGTRVASSFEAGAPIVWSLPNGAPAVDGTVIEARAPEVLTHTWVTRYDPELAKEQSTVTWRIEKRGDAVKLTVTHDLSTAPKTAAHVASDGWSVVLSSLKTVIETGEPLVVGEPAAAT